VFKHVLVARSLPIDGYSRWGIIRYDCTASYYNRSATARVTLIPEMLLHTAL
jgi:hypothetical protein